MTINRSFVFFGMIPQVFYFVATLHGNEIGPIGKKNDRQHVLPVV